MSLRTEAHSTCAPHHPEGASTMRGSSEPCFRDVNTWLPPARGAFVNSWDLQRAYTQGVVQSLLKGAGDAVKSFDPSFATRVLGGAVTTIKPWTSWRLHIHMPGQPACALLGVGVLDVQRRLVGLLRRAGYWVHCDRKDSVCFGLEPAEGAVPTTTGTALPLKESDARCSPPLLPPLRYPKSPKNCHCSPRPQPSPRGDVDTAGLTPSSPSALPLPARLALPHGWSPSHPLHHASGRPRGPRAVRLPPLMVDVPQARGQPPQSP